MKSSYLIAAGIAVAVTAWLASGLIDLGSDEDEPGPRPVAEADGATLAAVQVRSLTAEPHVREIVLFGRTEANRTVDLRAETSARVVEHGVVEGARVETGDLVVRLALDDRADRLREAEAEVEHRRIAYEAALKLSEKAFRSKVKLAEEKARLEQARAYLAERRLDIDRTRIRAPFAGVVETFVAEIGDVVDVQGEVARLVDLDPILVVGEVAERDAADIRVGDAARVRLVTGERFDGRVRYVSRVAEATTRTFRVEVEVDNPVAAVAEGVTAELRLPLGERLAHRVTPAVLTLNDAGEVGVKRIDADDRVRFNPVQLIDDTPDGIWLAGLPEHVRLIVVGQEFVREGQRVRPVPEIERASTGDAAS